MNQIDNIALNVLIIAKYDPTIDWMQFSLQEHNYHVVGRVESVGQALPRIKQGHIDVILADSSGDGVLDTEWIQNLVLYATGIIILVTAKNTEMDFVREAMLAGAQSFLLKPFDTTELSRSIEQVHRLWLQRQASLTEVMNGTQATTSRRAKSIAVFSPKGGTGVTTLAVNLAVALKHQADAPVLLVDADIRTADVDIFLNIFSKHSILDLIRLDQSVDNELLRSVATEHSTGVTVLRGDSRLQFLEAPIKPGQMSDVIEGLISCWDGYVVINTSNGLDRWTVEILDIVDTTLLVATPELPSLRVTRGFLDLAEAETDPSEKWQLVMTSYQSQKVLRMGDIEASVRYPILATIAQDTSLISTSINRGKPFVLSHKNSAIARDVLSLAKRLIDMIPYQSTSYSNEVKPTVPETEMSSPTKQFKKRFSFWNSVANSVRLPIG